MGFGGRSSSSSRGEDILVLERGRWVGRKGFRGGLDEREALRIVLLALSCPPRRNRRSSILIRPNAECLDTSDLREDSSSSNSSASA